MPMNLAINVYRVKLFLLLLLCAPILQAQTTHPVALTLNVHWYPDGAKCSCVLTVVKKGATDTTVFTGTTDSLGHLATTLQLDPFSTYSMNLYSNAYKMDIYGFSFSSMYLTLRPLVSLSFNLKFTRPPSTMPPVLPVLAPGTTVTVGI